MSSQPARLSLHWGTDDTVEDINRYVNGGFHPIRLGDVLRSDVANYRILHKLGRGSFATVWLAATMEDAQLSCSYHYRPKFVALKICVADADSQHELNIHSRLPPAQDRHVLQLLDDFSVHGPNGAHVVLVHDVLGSPADLTDLVQNQVRQLCKQLVQGVAFLHSHGITHGDIHAGNIGVCLPTLDGHSEDDILDYFGPPEISPILPRQPLPRPLDTLPPYLTPPIALAYYLKERNPSFVLSPLQIEIMDLGNATIVDEHPRPSCTPATVCAPEIMFERVTTKTDPPATFASDIWSLACTLYEIAFQARIFHFASPSNTLLVDMAKLCGGIPPEWVVYFDTSGLPKALDGTISRSAADKEWKRKVDHYARKWTEKDDIDGFVDFLRMMLKLDPGARPSAIEVLNHSWFVNR
ncbi:kinase-like domain-containing protein [Fomitopsis serialis]|uniref:kinase-like domain-containing protein n=1 Tax=Fomitopsis serialis TaxID=139415 RepID=UPI002008357F|nr:kinase-like domain-containing protein [Neoantrodia serialis]KAH9919043.1 kinase-like domain-containing protein [Neoantrodia serialis]